MPTYEYKCESCDRVFEKFQSMNDPRLESCEFENCDGKVKRLLGTGAGIIFKGSGFYETDYRSESYKSGQKKDSPKTESSSSKSKSESSSTSSSTKTSSDSGKSSSSPSKPKGD